MNREQFVKELEGLAEYRTCPDYVKQALSVIREQEQEIERLRDLVDEVAMYNEGYEKDNALLRQEVNRLDCICESYALQYGTAVDKEVILRIERADTVRKMQEMIEERCIKGGIYPAFVSSVIKRVAKEMLEGHGTPPEKCVSCGEIIPEGRQVCPTCEHAKGESK